MSYHGTGLRSSTNVKVPPKVFATKQVSHWATFGSRARAYYNSNWDLPMKATPNPNLRRYQSRGAEVTRIS